MPDTTTRKKLIKEFDRLCILSVEQGGWNVPYEVCVESMQRKWLIEAFDTLTTAAEAKARREALEEALKAVEGLRCVVCENESMAHDGYKHGVDAARDAVFTLLPTH